MGGVFFLLSSLLRHLTGMNIIASILLDYSVLLFSGVVVSNLSKLASPIGAGVAHVVASNAGIVFVSIFIVDDVLHATR